LVWQSPYKGSAQELKFGQFTFSKEYRDNLRTGKAKSLHRKSHPAAKLNLVLDGSEESFLATGRWTALPQN
jgi:hypothetical protein